ncbi:MAG: phosphatase PAP2 family protein [Prevotella sp.]|nr:phosphatase PAP2 family protein [Prevotella sp.]
MNMEPMKLTTPEMEPKLDYSVRDVRLEKLSTLNKMAPLTTTEVNKYQMTWMRTNPDVKPYKVMDDLTFVGIPVFAAGWIIKSEKNSFRQDYNNKHANTRLLTNFKTGIDDYTQYFGPALTVGLKLGGYEGRSDWGRLLASAAMSYGIMAGLVNGIKYTASEMRPDGSTANSWPSGHTATSFVGATMLHKEYGLTRSPWFSVAGYGVATATGVMRILNNRHWISDVLSGAGIGIMSTELGYALSDIIFKGKGLLRNDLEGFSENPSFFAISMGMSFGSKDIGFTWDDLTGSSFYKDLANALGDEVLENINIDFHTATSVDAEGAYFFNKYIGVGGRLRVRAMTAKSWGNFVGQAQDDCDDFLETVYDLYNATKLNDEDMMPVGDFNRRMDGVISDEEITVESDHLTEFSANVGLYLNLPLSKRFALGTKFLIGRTMTQELDINAAYKGTVKNMDSHIEIDNGELTALDLSNIHDGNKYDMEWDYLSMGGNNSTNYGTGISLTYKYKSNFSWRVFCDYDYSKKTFTLKYDPFSFMKVMTPDLSTVYEVCGIPTAPLEFEKEKKMHYLTIGASFAVSF